MKTIILEGIGEITLRKSARAKRLILKIDADGRPVATIPRLVPYAAAEAFIRKNRQWLQKNTAAGSSQLYPDMRIGKQHKLVFTTFDKTATASRVSKDTIRVYVPRYEDYSSQAVQQEARRAATRALRKEAETFLPTRLHQIAQKYGYAYSEVRVKAAQTRWGSCSQKRIINLSIWLMQLPDELVDYVICHELTHLHHMHHQKAFWEELAIMVPDFQAKRKQLRQYRPALVPRSEA